MANRRANSRVTGPTSALTEFLREQNIRVENTNRFRRRANNGDDEEATPEGGQTDQAVAGPSTAPFVSPFPSASTSASTSKLPRSDSNLGAKPPRPRPKTKRSQNYDESDEEDQEGGAPEKGDPMDLDGDADYEPESKDVVMKEIPTQQRIYVSNTTPVGALAYCVDCRKRFSVTAYTRAIGSGPLCHKCGPHPSLPGSSSSQSRAQGSVPDAPLSAITAKPAPKKRAPARRKTDGLLAWENQKPSLQTMCINIISNNIHDVDSLGSFGMRQKDELSKSICKSRRLDSHVLQLFLDKNITQLNLYDCSKLTSEAYQTIPTFAPNIKSINFQLCGQLDNDAIDAWAGKLKHLESLELYGPYLVRVESWKDFFVQTGSRLRSFKIRESPRFDLGCIETMIAHCPNIVELGLAQIGKLNAQLLEPLAYYENLTYLDISDPGVSAPGIPPESLKDEEVIKLLCSVGKNLTHLNLGKNAALTGKTIYEGVKKNCRRLRELNLAELVRVQVESYEDLFSDWYLEGYQSDDEADVTIEGCGFRKVVLRRNYGKEPSETEDGVYDLKGLNDQALKNLLKHSHKTLTHLDINSCTWLSRDSLIDITSCTCLQELDIGFVRDVDDDLLFELFKIPTLKSIKVFGCNKVTAFSHHPTIRVLGKEKYTL